MEAALVGGRCTAITADVTQLANMRAAFLGQKHNYSILPETITTDLAAPAYPASDRDWAAIVDRTVAALIQAGGERCHRGQYRNQGRKGRPGESPPAPGPTADRVLALGLGQDWPCPRHPAAVATSARSPIATSAWARPQPDGAQRRCGIKGGLLYPAPIRGRPILAGSRCARRLLAAGRTSELWLFVEAWEFHR